MYGTTLSLTESDGGDRVAQASARLLADFLVAVSGVGIIGGGGEGADDHPGGESGGANDASDASP